MKIVPLSFDSLGARSMATYVETKDVKILVDPGVSLAPSRYGLPPHEVEINLMAEHWERIVDYALKSDVLVVTHYHYDHHRPEVDLEIYDGKIVFVKHPKEKINQSQRRRAAYFLEKISGRPSEVVFADGVEREFGDTLLRFSSPVPHGTNTRLGYVVEVLVDDGRERFLHTSDVEGPALEEQVGFILDSKPNVVIVDGPMTYMLGYRYSRANLEKSIDNLRKVLELGPVRELYMDHHLLRDLRWRERMEPVFTRGEEVGVRVGCVADMLGVPENLLEARRKELYGKE